MRSRRSASRCSAGSASGSRWGTRPSAPRRAARLEVRPVTDPGEEARPPGVSAVLDTTFKVGLVLKAADGVLEIIAGTVLLLVSPSTLDRIAHSLTAHELGEDPHDRI